MINGADINARLAAGRSRRLSLVLALMIGLLASLIHCGSCDPAIAGSSTTVVALDLDGTTPPDTPDHKMPGHCGHCLNHVTGQPASAAALPSDMSHQAPPLGREQTLASLAGLPLFKPPRA